MRSIRILPLLAIVWLPGCDGTGAWLRGQGPAAAYAAPLASDSSVITARRVWSSASGSIASRFGAIMPDGNSLAAADWFSGQPQIFDLASREFRPLRPDDDSSDGAFAHETVVSPDGSRILFLWKSDEIRVTEVATGESRTIMTLDSATESYISPVAWSPAADSVFVLAYGPRHQDGPVRVVLIPVAGGTARLVHIIPPKADPWRVILSPDGRWLLYEHVLSRNQHPRADIYIIDVRDGGARPLIEHTGMDVLMGWLPGSDVVLFASDHSGTTDLWSVRVANGRVSGAPRLVRSGFFRSTAVGFGGGALFYTVRTGTYGQAVINVDPRSGALLGSASPPLEHLNTFPRAQAWSPDGHTLAVPSPPNAITLHSMETGDSRKFWLEDGVWAPILEWAADGKSLFLRAFGTFGVRTGPHHFLRLDLMTGKATRLFDTAEPEESGHIWRFLVTPDGRSLILRQQRILDDGRTGTKIVLRSLEDGVERELHRTADFIPELSISADGKYLAFVQQVWEKSDSLFVMTMDGSRPLRSVASWDYDAVSLLGWLPAGNALLAARLTKDGTGEEILRIELDGFFTVTGVSPFRPMRGRPVQGAYRSRLVLSPAGNRLSHAVHSTGQELWRMDGLHELFARDAASRR
jgi:Tol biopolymer transport system component